MGDFIVGDAITVLSGMQAKRFQACVTSPPYFQQRDYGFSGQLGLEKSVATYVQVIADVMQEVHRVLRDDGVLWLNLGDTFNAYNGGRGASSGKANRGSHLKLPKYPKGSGLTDAGYPNKCLLGVPWRTAFELVSRGWILRSDIVWRKTAPMPERVTDRPRRAHEMIFMFSKQARYRAACAGIADVWEFAPGQSRSAGHIAPFPNELVARCVARSTETGDEVLDPFVGSGTTVRVADSMGRIGTGIDLKAGWLHG